MAWELPGIDISLPTTSTGLVQYRFVNVSTSGNVIYPTGGGPSIGVIQDGTTGSTRQPRACTVRVAGVSKLAVVAGSTVGVGQIVVASSVGSAVGSTAGDYVSGRVIAGTSGSGARVLTVLVLPSGASTAL